MYSNCSDIQSKDVFLKEIEVEGHVLVDFWAPWCGPCRMQGPILDELGKTLGDAIRIVKVNVDENPILTDQFEVRGIPTLLLFNSGKLVHRFTGVQPLGRLVSAVHGIYQTS